MKNDFFHIFLLSLSCLVAYLFPFELFLFSYVVFGALHYLTELAWLHERKYFATKAEVWFILFCGIIVSLVYISYRLDLSLPFISSSHSTHLIFGALLVAILAQVQNWKLKLFFFLLGAAVLYFFRNSFYYLLLIGLLLPTIIHVFVFTALFMLVGIKKNPIKSTQWTFAIFLLCSISFWIIPVFDAPFSISDQVRFQYLESGFETLHIAIANTFDVPTTAIFENKFILRLQRFLAFAYTYHYLNWFLKVKIIAWHKVSRLRLTLSVLLWLVALSLYLYSFKLGILTLYFLSMLHVLMEFPLNVLTMKILLRK